jgi:FMN phosphatase YigB (HAD superfamily)
MVGAMKLGQDNPIVRFLIWDFDGTLGYRVGRAGPPRSTPCCGWTHLVLSNHVPELPGILHNLGLDGHLHQIFNSAESGYEKPHPRAFDAVLGAVAGAEAAWMVGDNLESDVRGAEAVGLPAILVRGPKRDAQYHCEDLHGAAGIVERA